MDRMGFLDHFDGMGRIGQNTCITSMGWMGWGSGDGTLQSLRCDGMNRMEHLNHFWKPLDSGINSMGRLMGLLGRLDGTVGGTVESDGWSIS